MTSRWTPFEILTGTGAGFLCIAFACVFLEAGRVETRLAARAAAALDDAGLYWSAVAPQGRRLIVSGAAADPATAAAAGARLEGIPGVGAIENGIAVIGAAGVCQTELDAVRSAQPVTFRKGQAELAPASDSVLGAIADVLQRCAVQVEVAVHAEAGSSAALALALTQRRAEQVARRLVANGAGIEQVIATGYGFSQPVASRPRAMPDSVTTAPAQGDAVGRSIDQRVEFRVLGAAAT